MYIKNVDNSKPIYFRVVELGCETPEAIKKFIDGIEASRIKP
jgi:hypothetical protein